ncbi:TauD/TfdA family dioxygenase [Streptomyces sp. NPDC000618]|uniref:TauD/TfdA dioxygenase family protein n=1 Tax=Streptomyces sp. NPDC000618 TaxID=3154265 RepID=UPI003330FF39
MITATRVAGGLGGLIEGVRITDDMDEVSVAGIHAALLKYKVVFLRNQHGLDDAGQVAFASRLGNVTLAHPMVKRGDNSMVLPVDSQYGKANSWHTDVTFVDRVPAISILRAVRLTPYGGETTWANTAAAYASLPEPLQALAVKLWAVHTNVHDYAGDDVDDVRIGGIDVKAEASIAEYGANVFECEHPVVRVHPETGERCILLGRYAKRFVDVTNGESRLLYQLLQERVTRLENTVRWHWRQGDVAIWDNRATQHYAIADYGDLPRVMHRVTVAGDIPVAVDGRQSKMRAGDPSAYSRLP